MQGEACARNHIIFSCSRDAFVGFRKNDVIVPRVRVQSRVPGFKEKSLVEIGFETNDPDVFKVQVSGASACEARQRSTMGKRNW